MPQNVEIKAKIGSEERAREMHQKLAQLCEANGPAEVMRQEDTFFKAKNGRLKLRQLEKIHISPAEKHCELIFYERSDEEGPKLSDFIKVAIPNEECPKLKEALSRAHGIKGSVSKQRSLYIYRHQTRVHLDQVHGLGNFIEFEVCLREGQTLEEGTAIADQLMAKLGIPEEDLLKGAYLDLLQSANMA